MFFVLFNQLCIQCQCVWCLLPNNRRCVVSCPLLLLFFLFWVFGYTHAQLRSLCLLSTFDAFHVTKNTRLSTPTQLQCSHSKLWEPGNEAIFHVLHILIFMPSGGRHQVCWSTHDSTHDSTNEAAISHKCTHGKCDRNFQWNCLNKPWSIIQRKARHTSLSKRWSHSRTNQRSKFFVLWSKNGGSWVGRGIESNIKNVSVMCWTMSGWSHDLSLHRMTVTWPLPPSHNCHITSPSITRPLSI